MVNHLIPWVLGGVSAVWFALLAVRAGKSWVLWGLAGGIFGLVSSTFVFGLGHATGIPFSDRSRYALHVEWTLAAIALILLIGGLITWTLWRKSRAAASAQAQSAPGPEKKPTKNAA